MEQTRLMNAQASSDVKQDCKATQARLCQPSQENQASAAHDEASSSSRQALPHVGAPKAQDVDKMNKFELMKYAKTFSVRRLTELGPMGKNSLPFSVGCEARLQGGAGQALPAFARESGI